MKRGGERGFEWGVCVESERLGRLVGVKGGLVVCGVVKGGLEFFIMNLWAIMLDFFVIY